MLGMPWLSTASALAVSALRSDASRRPSRLTSRPLMTSVCTRVQSTVMKPWQAATCRRAAPRERAGFPERGRQRGGAGNERTGWLSLRQPRRGWGGGGGGKAWLGVEGRRAGRKC